MEVVIPGKLKAGDLVFVIAPSKSFAVVDESVRAIAANRFNRLGLKVVFGQYVEESDQFGSSSITHRLADLHSAFANREIKGIFSVIGGYNANQLIPFVDWELIKKNPKIFCGFSDITVLENAIFQQTGLVTYHGPHYSAFGQKRYFDYTFKYFKKCCFSNAPYTITAPNFWSDDRWWEDQQQRELIEDATWGVVRPGMAQGRAIGGNLSSFQLLKGTPFYPQIEDTILFLENEESYSLADFDRELEALTQMPQFQSVRGIVIGRFQNSSGITPRQLKKVLTEKKQLASIPLVYNVDFGHTSPIFTFPIGGLVKVTIRKGVRIEVLQH